MQNEFDETLREDKTIFEPIRFKNQPEKTLKEVDKNYQEEGSLLRTWKGFKVLKELPAEGGEADVYLISDSNESYILKLYRKGMEPKETVLSNIKQLSERFSEHIVKVIEYGYDSELNRWFERQEYATYGSLKNFMTTGRLSVSQIKEIIKEINEALGILHQHGIIHRDLKPSNILLRSIDPIDLVFTDFGISSVIEEDVSKKFTTVKGTPLYSAPEAFSGVLGKEVDYWALGIIVYEMLTGKNPFTGLSIQTIIYRLTTEDVKIPEVDVEYKQLLMGLLTRNPKKRWGYEQVKDWLEGKEVPVYFAQEKVDNKNAYKFMDKNFYEPESLALGFIENEESFEMAKKHLAKGYVKLWFNKIEDIDKVIWLDEITENSKSSEELVVRFVYNYHKSLPLILYGKNISVEYIKNLILASTIQKLSGADRKNYELLEKNKLSRIIEIYEEITENTNPDLIYLVHKVEEAFKENKIDDFSKLLYYAENGDLETFQYALADIFSPPYSIDKILESDYIRFIFSEDFIQLLSKYSKKQIVEQIKKFSKSIESQINVIKNESICKLTSELFKLGMIPKILIFDANNVLSQQILKKIDSYKEFVIFSGKEELIKTLSAEYDLVAVLTNNDKLNIPDVENVVYVTNSLNASGEKHYFCCLPNKDFDNDKNNKLLEYILNMLRVLSLSLMLKRVILQALNQEKDFFKSLITTLKFELNISRITLDTIKAIELVLSANQTVEENTLKLNLISNINKSLEEHFDKIKKFLVNHKRQSKFILEKAIFSLKGEDHTAKYFEIYDYEKYTNELSERLTNIILYSDDLKEIVGKMVYIDYYLEKSRAMGTRTIILGIVLLILFILSGLRFIFIILAIFAFIRGIIEYSDQSKAVETRFKKHPKYYKKFCKILEKKYSRFLEEKISQTVNRYVTSCCEALINDSKSLEESL